MRHRIGSASRLHRVRQRRFYIDIHRLWMIVDADRAVKQMNARAIRSQLPVGDASVRRIVWTA